MRRMTGFMTVLALGLAPLSLRRRRRAGSRVRLHSDGPRRTVRTPRACADTRELGRCFALTLVPVGLTMWVAHLLFHLLSGWDSVVPVGQRALLGVGWLRTGYPSWVPTGPGFSGTQPLGIEILLLDAGLLLTLYAMWRTARTSLPRAKTALGAMLPWAGMAVGLYCVGIWTFLQPMQMRGMMMH